VNMDLSSLKEIPARSPGIPSRQPSEAKERPWSSLIDKAERDKAWDAGHSMDAKKVTSALGYLDLK
jgi:hypothetical protein